FRFGKGHKSAQYLHLCFGSRILWAGHGYSIDGRVERSWRRLSSRSGEGLGKRSEEDRASGRPDGNASYGYRFGRRWGSFERDAQATGSSSLGFWRPMDELDSYRRSGSDVCFCFRKNNAAGPLQRGRAKSCHQSAAYSRSRLCYRRNVSWNRCSRFYLEADSWGNGRNGGGWKSCFLPENPEGRVSV